MTDDERRALLDPRAQLREIALLKPGWLDGGGEVPTARLLAAVGEWFDGLMAAMGSKPDMPRIYPHPDGGVTAEWVFRLHDVSIDFSDREGFGPPSACMHVRCMDGADVLRCYLRRDWAAMARKFMGAKTYAKDGGFAQLAARLFADEEEA